MPQEQYTYAAVEASNIDADDFLVDLKSWKSVDLDINSGKLSKDQKDALLHNVALMRDSIVLFTATGAARGVSGHTGGPFDTAPEVVILSALFDQDAKKTKGESYVPIVFDEAGHRVATQYFLSALHGDLPAEHLLHYRAANSKLPGHPELGLTPGVRFSSGRLGHLWSFCNGISFANREKTVFCLSSDGSFQEGNDAEAARIAVANKLNIKLFFDDNDVTIAGHPSEYLHGYDLKKTLEGHGVTTIECKGEDIDSLFGAISTCIKTTGPAAVVVKRKMAPGIEGIEGTSHGHDVIPVDKAIAYLKKRGYERAEEVLKGIHPSPTPYLHVGSTKEVAANRVQFGEAVADVLDKAPERKKDVFVIDSDLEGSTGLKVIHTRHPEVFQPSGIMERSNLSAAAGFGFDANKFGVFSTFSAFLEMCISEITMARLNHVNLLCHFSHSGVDEMADNTCHFGVNNFFADNGLSDVESYLYFPADALQMSAVIDRIFFEHGMRFVFSTRSKVPYILKEGSKTERFFDPATGYRFQPGVDEVVREGKDGYIVTFGEMLYRCVDAVDRINAEGNGPRVGLINKVSLNLIDEKAMRMYGSSKFVIVVESFNAKTGLGSKMGTWLLERGMHPKFARIGTNKEGCGGLTEQIPFQGLDPESIKKKVVELNSMQ